jgi:RNA polymerase sigma-70 factor (ECF subfamily)
MAEGAKTSDGRLLKQAKAGDDEAFARLVDRHKDALIAYLTRLTGDRTKAEDLAQEAFLRVYERSSYEERGLFKAYLFRIATNLLRSQQRRAQRWERLRNLIRSQSGFRTEPSQERRLLRLEAREALGRALAALPLHYREPLVLHDIDGWRYQEISEALGCREGTVKSRIHRGRRLLREALTPLAKGQAS